MRYAQCNSNSLQWWTLYFYGEQDAMDGMINYIFLKAANSVGKVFIYNALVIPKEFERHSENDEYTLEEWSADANTTCVRIGTDNIFEQNVQDNSITVRGCSKSKLMRWDLKIVPKFEPLFVCKDFAFHTGNTLNFVSLVPAGTVQGTVELKGKQYAIDSFGECEHIYGPSLLPLLSWQFIHGYDPKTNSMIYMLYVPDRGGSICFEYQNKRYYKTEFDWDNVVMDLHYPQRINILSHDNEMSIVIKTTSISASEASSASENHVFIHVKFKNQLFTLEGMAEYNQGGWAKLLLGSALPALQKK